jgi:hypothetical protein
MNTIKYKGTRIKTKYGANTQAEKGKAKRLPFFILPLVYGNIYKINKFECISLAILSMEIYGTIYYNITIRNRQTATHEKEKRK